MVKQDAAAASCVDGGMGGGDGVQGQELSDRDRQRAVSGRSGEAGCGRVGGLGRKVVVPRRRSVMLSKSIGQNGTLGRSCLEA